MANEHYRVSPPPYPGAPPERHDPDLARQTEGVLGRRLFAYLIDLLMIALFAALLWVVIAILGLVTFGLGWVLFAILPFAGILYSAITVGGSKQSTIGMRVMGLRVVNLVSGRPVDLVTAGAHALLFYVAASTFILWLIDVAVGLGRSDRRLGHDLLVGLALVRGP